MDDENTKAKRSALLSPGGASIFKQHGPCNKLLVGTTDGIWSLRRQPDGDWSLAHKALAGTFISSIARTADGALIAGAHHYGVARSDDEGLTWRWINKGLGQFDVWVVKADRLDDRDLIFAGTMPAHIFVSDNGGEDWTDLSAIRQVPTAAGWFFPPPPHLGHVKDIVVGGGTDLIVGIEVGALLRSTDKGESFVEIPVADDFTDIDIHRVLVHHDRPDRLIAATGWGVKISNDRGATWARHDAADINYPDAMVLHPADPDLIFVAGALGYPPNWYKINRARPRLARSRDGGKTWTRLLGGFPDGQRAAIGAMSLVAWNDGFAIYTGDTDGQIYESRDGGETWQMIFETGAVSKGEHYRGLAKGRPPMTDLDSLKFAAAGQSRVDSAKA